MRRMGVSRVSARWVLFLMLAAAAVVCSPATASAQVQFHAIGDLPGGSFHSEIRDATKVGSTILAVGGSNGQTSGCTDPCGVSDTAILWKWDGTSGTITALPNLVVNTSATTPIIASAITPDGAYIASRGRSHPFNGQRQAVRVTTALVPFPSANQDLSTRFSPALSPNTAAVAISNGGSILYGFAGSGSAVRFDAAGASSALIAPPPGASSITPAARGTSADGSVMVATANIGPGQTFRYVEGSGLAQIPVLAGGSWNKAVAVSTDGNLVLVAGDSSAYRTAKPISTTPRPARRRPWVLPTRRGRRTTSAA